MFFPWTLIHPGRTKTSWGTWSSATCGSRLPNSQLARAVGLLGGQPWKPANIILMSLARLSTISCSIPWISMEQWTLSTIMSSSSSAWTELRHHESFYQKSLGQRKKRYTKVLWNDVRVGFYSSPNMFILSVICPMSWSFWQEVDGSALQFQTIIFGLICLEASVSY